MKLSLHKLLFLFSFCLFICPKNVFAAEQLVMNPVSAATYTLNSETYVTNQLHEVGMGQNKFKTFHSGNISYFVYKYELDKDIPRSDVSLRLMIGTYTTTTFIEPPLVSLNGTTCNTYVTGDSGLTSERQLESGQTFTEGTYVGESALVHVYSDYEYYHDFEYWYRSVYSGNTTVNVLCKDIDLTRNVTIYVWVPNHSSVDYGISSNWYYSVVNGVESKLDETNKRLDEQKKATEEQTKTLKDSDTTESTGKAGSFFSDFKSEDYGLSDIITLPLEFIKSLNGSSCKPLKIEFPFVDEEMNLPCMLPIYETYFGGFLEIYQAITFGMIAYWVCVNVFRMVKNFKDPTDDEIEVLDL